ncbi:hypothetical protein [Pseudoduganella sp. OTU4001]|uniref:hypothetical protein n=1 Tax=Pseudoduganella sp. OTU4001 TaxID=3043854 RepID=UPI00313C10C2
MKPFIAALLAVPALASAQPADPQPEELLQIVFPKWADEEGGRVVSIPTSTVTRGWDTRQGKQRKVAIVPRQVVRVAPDRLVLLAAMTPVGESGDLQVSHGTPIGLSAYTFKPGKDGWQVARRQEPFDLQGFEGRVQMDVVPLPAAPHALHVSWGSCWQGHCVDLFALYAIGMDGVQAQPLVLQKIKGGNVYSRPDCVDRLGGLLPGLAPPDGADEKVPPGKCYAVEGRWEISGGGALTIRFKGAMSTASKQANEPARRVDQVMKFEFRGGRYVPVSGSNPVPDA